MDKEIKEILIIEEKAKAIIENANNRSLKIRSKTDIEISNRSKSIKDEINCYLKKESKNAIINSLKEHKLKIDITESTVLFNTVPMGIKEKLIDEMVAIIMDTTFKMVKE